MSSRRSDEPRRDGERGEPDSAEDKRRKRYKQRAAFKANANKSNTPFNVLADKNETAEEPNRYETAADRYADSRSPFRPRDEGTTYVSSYLLPDDEDTPKRGHEITMRGVEFEMKRRRDREPDTPEQRRKKRRKRKASRASAAAGEADGYSDGFGHGSETTARAEGRKAEEAQKAAEYQAPEAQRAADYTTAEFRIAAQARSEAEYTAAQAQRAAEQSTRTGEGGETSYRRGDERRANAKRYGGSEEQSRYTSFNDADTYGTAAEGKKGEYTRTTRDGAEDGTRADRISFKRNDKDAEFGSGDGDVQFGVHEKGTGTRKRGSNSEFEMKRANSSREKAAAAENAEEARKRRGRRRAQRAADGGADETEYRAFNEAEDGETAAERGSGATAARKSAPGAQSAAERETEQIRASDEDYEFGSRKSDVEFGGKNGDIRFGAHRRDAEFAPGAKDGDFEFRRSTESGESTAAAAGVAGKPVKRRRRAGTDETEYADGEDGQSGSLFGENAEAAGAFGAAVVSETLADRFKADTAEPGASFAADGKPQSAGRGDIEFKHGRSGADINAAAGRGRDSRTARTRRGADIAAERQKAKYSREAKLKYDKRDRLQNGGAETESDVFNADGGGNAAVSEKVEAASVRENSKQAAEREAERTARKTAEREAEQIRASAEDYEFGSRKTDIEFGGGNGDMLLGARGRQSAENVADERFTRSAASVKSDSAKTEAEKRRVYKLRFEEEQHGTGGTDGKTADAGGEKAERGTNVKHRQRIRFEYTARSETGGGTGAGVNGGSAGGAGAKSEKAKSEKNKAGSDKTGSEKEKADNAYHSEEYHRAKKRAERYEEKINKAKKKQPRHNRMKFERTFDEKTGKAETKVKIEKELKKPVKADTRLFSSAVYTAGGVRDAMLDGDDDNAGLEAGKKAGRLSDKAIVTAYRRHKNKPYRMQRKINKLQNKANRERARMEFEAEREARDAENKILQRKFYRKSGQQSYYKKMYYGNLAKRMYRKIKELVKKLADKIKNAANAVLNAIGIKGVLVGVAAIIVLMVSVQVFMTLIAAIGGAADENVTTAADTAAIGESWQTMEDELRRAATDNIFGADYPDCTIYYYGLYDIGVDDMQKLLAYYNVKNGKTEYAGSGASLTALFNEVYSWDVRVDDYDPSIVHATLNVKNIDDMIDTLTADEKELYDMCMEVYLEESDYEDVWSELMD